MNFTSLHTHSEFSQLDGMTRVPEMVEYAKEHGGAIAMTDHRNMLGIAKFSTECIKNGVKPIIGCEINLIVDPDDNTRGYHAVVLAMNKIGYRNLCRVVSSSYKHFKYVPRVLYSDLVQNKEGLILSTGCIGGLVPSLILEQKYEMAKGVLSFMANDFKDNFYIEYHNHGIQYERIVNQFLEPWGNELGVPICACVDTHYAKESDMEFHKVLVACGMQKSYKTIDGFAGDGYHLLSDRELLDRFPREYINNTLDISSKCDMDVIEWHNDLAPRYRE